MLKGFTVPPPAAVPPLMECGGSVAGLFCTLWSQKMLVQLVLNFVI